MEFLLSRTSFERRNERAYQLARKYEVRKRIIRVRDASKLPSPSASGIDETTSPAAELRRLRRQREERISY